MAQNWFKQIKGSNLSFEIKSKSGCLQVVNNALKYKLTASIWTLSKKK